MKALVWHAANDVRVERVSPHAPTIHPHPPFNPPGPGSVSPARTDVHEHGERQVLEDRAAWQPDA